ncbi:MAG: YceD family protein [Acidobacteriota bacterium]
MAEHWLDITDLPAEGREFSFEEKEFWADKWAEFQMGYVALTPMSATFTVQPQQRGALVRGRLTGEVSTPCDRCLKDVSVGIDQPFDVFEQLESSDEESVEPGLLREHKGRLELDAGAMLWEEFVLALPTKPLCSEDCKGLCPTCGKDLNEGPCGCAKSEGDERMAALRGLTIAKKD